MYRLFFMLWVLSSVPTQAFAQEYCVDRYEAAITNINGELGALVRRQATIDRRLSEIIARLLDLATQITTNAMLSISVGQPIDDATKRLGDEFEVLKREKTELEAEGYRNQDRIVVLKGVIPASLQGELRGCIEATAPANRFVNTAIQALAILSTGGLALTLPPKSLYVDMSAVLNGYPTGGEPSVINEARTRALDALGIGGDLRRGVEDPGRVVRCALWGC